MQLGASYSTVSETELLERLVPLYAVDDAESCRFWERGVNDTYQVQCANARYSLRVYRHGLRSREAVDFEVAALLHLAGRGAKVAGPIERRDGGYVSELSAPEGPRYAILTTHAEGAEPDYDDVEMGRLFGASVAELHRWSEGFATRHVRPALDLAYLLDRSLEIIVPFCEQSAPGLAMLEATAGDLRRTVSAVPTDTLDVGFCHGDCHGCNVHLHEGSMTHFDFDCCGVGLRVFEWATFKWGIRGDDNEQALWSAFIEGYRATRDIGENDLALVDTFVVIRHLWWMALIMGNARDFGASAVSAEFVDRNLDRVRSMFKSIDRSAEATSPAF